MKKKSKDKKFQESVLHEMIRIKKQYCVNCEYFIKNECSKGKLYRNCLRENGRVKKEKEND